MKNLLIILIVVFMLLISFNVWGEEESQQGRVLRFGHCNAPLSFSGLAATRLANLVEERTDGQLKVEVYPNSQLGSMKEMVEMVAAGTIAFYSLNWSTLALLMEEFAVFDTPYLITNVDDAIKLIDPYTSPVMQKLNDKLIEERGVRILYGYHTGVKVLTCNKKVLTPDDLKGEKIRSMPFEFFVAAIKGLGAIPIPIDYADLGSALATGTVIGQDNALDKIYEQGFYDSQKYLIFTDHSFMTAVCVINEGVWQSLTQQQKDTIIQISKEQPIWYNKLIEDNTEEYLEKLKAKGMIVIGPEDGLRRDLFKANTDKVVNEMFGVRYGDLYEEINSYLGYK